MSKRKDNTKDISSAFSGFTDKTLLQFSRRLEMIREVRGLKQKDLAAAAGITEALVSAYINGKREPGLKNIIRLSDALGVSPALFFCPRLDSMNMASPCWEDGEDAGSHGDTENPAVSQAALSPHREIPLSEEEA